MSKNKEIGNKKIMIMGVTDEGILFRPSDWVERMCGSLSTFKNHRIYYSPLLSPSTNDGNRCLIVDASLETLYPELFSYILNFAKTNNLKICEVDDVPPEEI